MRFRVSCQSSCLCKLEIDRTVSVSLNNNNIKAGAIVMSRDSSVAKSYASRRGIGRISHMAVKKLWLQDLVCRGRIAIDKVPGKVVEQ